ncbi:TMAO reductase system sensor histidine kinase/response regulator TorS [Shewanella marina]|uniref:TMAO reductase system sensor histidine kinase/response regulator TorS n=1 Tax=Shewanella marina TaxID=487319 RepID=UPI000472E25E|nr:TMAO reductase system sensor histidine kinase/response regulator TorS [Shewanella marina]
MIPLSFSGTSLIGRLMLAFSLLGLLLLIQVSLGNLSLYWVKQADQYLYEQALPASQAARQLAHSSTALSENAKQLGQLTEEVQRQFVGRKLAIDSSNMLSAIDTLNKLNVDTNLSLQQRSENIIAELVSLGNLVGQRLKMESELAQLGRTLSNAASQSSELLQGELAIVNATIVSKLSLAYPQQVGDKKTAELLDDVIEQEIDTQSQLTRALKQIHSIALLSQMFQSPTKDSQLLNAMTTDKTVDLSRLGLVEAIDVKPLLTVDKLIRDPARSQALSKQIAILLTVVKGIELQRQYNDKLQDQRQQLQNLSDKLYGLNAAVEQALNAQQHQAEQARNDYLNRLLWAKLGLWLTGGMMLIVILFVVYKVIYQGIAIRLNQAATALSKLSLGDTDVSINHYGDDELAVMANALEAFKIKTIHNQKLQSQLRQSAAELTEHKRVLERKVVERTSELALANEKLDTAAKEHEQARAIAEQANQAKSLFLATMSHEIRTPLNGLLGTLTLLGHSSLPPAQQQMLALSRYSGTLLQTVLNDILDFSRLEQGKLNNEPRPVDMVELINEVIAVMVAGANLSGLKLTLQNKNVPKWLRIDGPKLRQILFNLIGNAIKFTPEGEVTLRIYPQQDWLHFEVIDTGVGINEEAQKQLFKAYSTQPNQGRARGTGLGLAICKQLVELMNPDTSKTIQLESEEGLGSCFSFCLPIEECAPITAAHNQLRELVPSKLVLVVEDNQINAMVAQGFLAYIGHESVLANSCEQALSLFTPELIARLDAVMLDIQLGDGSGIELLRQLKLKSAIYQKSIQFAAFTAQIQSENIHEYQDVGFDQVLAKPLSMESLTTWLGSAVREDVNQEPVIELMDPAALLDLNQINQDKDILGEQAVIDMLQLYITSSQVHLQSLLEHNGDSAKVLHALKGSSGSMGLSALAERCKLLEHKALTDEDIDSLHQLQQASISALEAYLKR